VAGTVPLDVAQPPSAVFDRRSKVDSTNLPPAAEHSRGRLCHIGVPPQVTPHFFKSAADSISKAWGMIDLRVTSIKSVLMSAAQACQTPAHVYGSP
jgi:hypothetical protein